MKSSKALTIISISVLLISMSITASAGNRVFFYENKVTHKIDSDYSKFKEALEKEGYNILRAEVPLSKSVIEDYNPDVIIIPGLSSQLDAGELNALAKFVIQDGRGLFIVGGGQHVNQLLPFGIVVDNVELEDSTDPIVDAGTRQPSTKKKEFVVKAPFSRDDSTIKTILYTVYEIGFFGCNGIYISGDVAKPILTGDWDTSTSTGSFPPGSRPTVAISARVGKGLIFFISDDDILGDTHLDTAKYKYDNLQLGMNIVGWLSIPSELPENISIEEIRIMVGELKIERDRLNETLAEIQEKRDSVMAHNRGLIAELDEVKKEIEKIKDAYFLEQWSVTYSTIVGLVILIILISAQRALMRRSKGGAEKEEVGEFGYEFEEEPEGLEFGEEIGPPEGVEGEELEAGEELPDLGEENSGTKKKKE